MPKAIVDAIDCASEDVQWYANAKTGEVRCFACSYDSEIDDEEDGFEADVPPFSLSTFDTDYILVKEERLGNAVAALREDGCGVAEADQQ